MTRDGADELLLVLMQRASVFVGVTPRLMPRRDVEAVIDDDPVRARAAIDALLAGGFLLQDRNGRLRSIKPFRSSDTEPLQLLDH